MNNVLREIKLILVLSSKQDDWRHIQTLQREQVSGNDIYYTSRRRDKRPRRTKRLHWRVRKESLRSSLNGKIKGLGSYGKYGRASSYPGQRNKRRQKVSMQVHAGQLEKVREGVPNIPPLHEKKSRVLAERKKERKRFKKNDWRRKKTHTHTHTARAHGSHESVY